MDTKLSPAGSIDSGAIAIPGANVHNYGRVTGMFYVFYPIGAGVDSLLQTLTAGGDSTVSFANWTAIQPGQDSVSAQTRLTDDMISGNDAKYGSVLVNVHDVGPSAILTPAGSVPIGTIAPQARLTNYGTTRPNPGDLRHQWRVLQ